jgi:hypothetical protein
MKKGAVNARDQRVMRLIFEPSSVRLYMRPADRDEAEHRLVSSGVNRAAGADVTMANRSVDAHLPA